MRMKILFWILAVLSLPVGCFISFVCHFAHGLDLYWTGFGLVVCILGMLSLVVCIIGIVLGAIKLRRGQMKKAFGFVLMGVIYSGIIFGGLVVDDALYSMRLNKAIEAQDEQMYGENWNDPPAIEGLPEQYQKLLNKFYVMVRDQWPADKLMELGAVSMAEHYGDASLDNIGFVLMDLDGDKVDELVLGTTAPMEEGGTAIFCIYASPKAPAYAINSVEGNTYYLHAGETEGTYEVEIADADAAWVVRPKDPERSFDFDYREGKMDPDGRMTLELIPFSRYK